MTSALVRVLESHERDLSRSASILGIHRKTLLRKLRQYGMASGYGVSLTALSTHAIVRHLTGRWRNSNVDDFIIRVDQ